MSNIIERVAKAICLSRSCEGYSCCQNPSMMARRSGKRRAGDANCPVQRGGYDDAASAAVEAMRNAFRDIPGPVGNKADHDEWNMLLDILLKVCDGAKKERVAAE